MKITKHLLSIATMGALFLSVLVLPAYSGVLTFNEATGGTAANNNQTVGWEFNVLSPVTVDDLEWFDPTGSGLNTAHTVGIFNSSGVLLTSATIAAGTADPLDGMFRIVALTTPITLAVGDDYTVGGTNSTSNTDRVACGGDVSPEPNCLGTLTYTLNPSLAFDGAAFSLGGTGLTWPDTTSAAMQGFFGPSFSVEAVPAPAIGHGLLVLLAIGTVLLKNRLSQPGSRPENARAGRASASTEGAL